jgi:hypothetical protein
MILMQGKQINKESLWKGRVKLNNKRNMEMRKKWEKREG